MYLKWYDIAKFDQNVNDTDKQIHAILRKYLHQM